MAFSPAPTDQAPNAGGLFARTWTNWLQAVALALNLTVRQLQSVRLTAQVASIATTAFSLSKPLTDGRYSVRYYLRITQAATTSSSATVTIGWTDGGVACSQSFAAVTGNTTATTQNGLLTIRCDANTNVTYAVAYATVGATAMTYSWDAMLEQLPQ